ncbi:MAG: hypothetical protein GX751_08245 [Desulfuromonadaceae bacterium]|jgi:hypothetical protein|nr:hypothetical protein [Desulfuromonadaceae bacterium]
MKGVSFLVALLFVVVSSVTVLAAPAPQKVVDLANGQLAELGKDKVIVKAVRRTNAEGRTMDEIKKIDEEWIAAKKAGTAYPLMTEMMENDCAKHLKEIMAAHPFITEIFVTGNLGGNVCQTAPTGDFWQGDEAKFKEVYKKGILVGEVEQEDGKNISLVSVPVKMGELHVGTMNIGVDVDKVP